MGSREVIEAVAEAVADGERVDWQGVENRTRDAVARRQLQSLRSIGWLIESAGGTSSRVPSAHGWAVSPSSRVRLVAALIGGIAALQILVALVLLASRLIAARGAVPVMIYGRASALVAFSAAALLLIAGGRRDRRAWFLGLFYLLIGSSFAQGFLGLFAPPGIARGGSPDVFLPAALWLFAREFPRVHRYSVADRFASLAASVSFWIGLVLFAVTLVPRESLIWWLRAFSRSSETGALWGVLYALMLPVVVVIPLRATAAPVHERSRVRLFGLALLAGIVPMLLAVLAEVLIPPFRAWVDQPGHRWWAVVLLFGFLVTTPLTTAYVVLSRGTLDVTGLRRRGYAVLLARPAALILFLVPLLTLVWIVRQRPAATAGALLADPAVLVSLATAVLGAVVLAARERLLAVLDWRSRSAEGDYRRLLARVHVALRSATTPAGIAEEISAAIAAGCRAQRVSVLLRAPGADSLVCVAGAAPPLAPGSAVDAVLHDASTPLRVDPDDPGSLFSLLPEQDALWVLDSKASLIFPLNAANRDLVGCVVVSRKNAYAPLTRDDELLAGAVASGALFALEAAWLRAGEAARTVEASAGDGAYECTSCGDVGALAAACARCGRTVEPASLPLVLAGKFRLRRRLGAGGMGIVYEADDAALGRSVVLKTLPRASAEALRRFQREARAMAAVTHPHLAEIHGIETWHGRPFLIVEYLSGGTLAAALRSGPMQPGRVRAIGLDLASALECVHASGLLHRDIKPANIAFASDGRVKLLDFGLAHLMEAPESGRTDAAGSKGAPEQSASLSGQLAGTPLYLSPEIVRGGRWSEQGDVWALALVLYEALAGSHPFAGGSVEEVLRRIDQARVPHPAAIRAGAAGPLADTLAECLDTRRSRRPATARELRQRLERACGT